MALFELDQYGTYQDMNDLKTLQAAASQPANLGVGEVWLKMVTSVGPYYILKRFNGAGSDDICGVQFRDNTNGKVSNICIQCGRTSNPSGGIITFDMAFSYTPRVIAFCETGGSGGISWIVQGSVTTTGFQTMNLTQGGQGGGYTAWIQWQAVGVRLT